MAKDGYVESATTTGQETTAELKDLREYVREVDDLVRVSMLAAWDEKTQLPANASEGRARQMGMLAGLVHERATADTFDRCISAVEAQDPDDDEARVCRRDFDLSTKLPGDFVRQLAEVSSRGYAAWEKARGADDFAVFAPVLEQIVELSRQKAEYLGYTTEPWDALHDLYEQGMTAAELDPLFAELREPLRSLLERQPEADTSVLRRNFPIEQQREYAHVIAKAVGFDLQSGRIDPTTHPFCITVGPGDVRLTTRYDENWLSVGVFATVHEAGHGIYEQSFQRLGVPGPLAESPGLGMHESQSRMYENIVGRSRAFWEFHYDELQSRFPESLGDVELDTFYRAINAAEPSLIRVEADELTYNLHIGLRFELERALMNGDLKVADLPEAWNDGMERWVGVRPQSDAEGVLQDMHWSGDSFGYFPTYTLGNIYSSQFVEAARKDIGDLEAQMRQGDLSKLIGWFDENVYQHGRRYTGRQFVERISGGPISVQPMLAYLETKFGAM